MKPAIKLFTQVDAGCIGDRISLADKVAVIGSCFADSMGKRMEDGGFNVLVNPFGTLYNPASIASAVRRLDSGAPYTQKDCVQMGAGSSLICSFEHHTSFAREDASAFLADANAHLAEASAFWKQCGKVVVTLGTACVWEHESFGIVGNCLKRDAREFSHRMLSVEECETLLSEMTDNHPDKKFIFTVSPIRYMSQGAHSNTVSKATLHLALNRTAGSYFPAFEILNDELRDYRYYADDLVHPSKLSCEIIWERFLEYSAVPDELPEIYDNLRRSKSKYHKQG